MIAGVDEAGVGCLMGIMVAGAVVLPPEFDVTPLNDSKKMSEKRREEMAKIIREKAYVGVGVITNTEIDTLGMAKCRRLVFHRALDELAKTSRFDRIIVDGTLFEDYHSIPHECIPKADATVPAVSAASIIAKTFRDDHVMQLCARHPESATLFGWKSNKGYPSATHLQAVRTHGVIPSLYRMSYAPCARAMAEGKTLELA